MSKLSFLSDSCIINDPLSTDGFESIQKMFLCDRVHHAPQNGLFSTLLIRPLTYFLTNSSFQS